ncbi:MAG: putative glycoside hydrolase [Elusimicrobiota bacterium]
MRGALLAAAAISAALLAAAAGRLAPAEGTAQKASTTAVRQLILAQKPLRGIHLSAWGSGSQKSRRALLDKISDSVINGVVVAVKEVDGKVFIPGVAAAHKYGAYAPAIADPEAMMRDFKAAGLYTAARVVVFKDKVLPQVRRDLAVRLPDGGLWRANNGDTWADPYNREVWAYVLDVAERAAELGFDEIQFDYIRYPTEGRTSQCRYSRPHTSASAIQNLADFLVYARGRLARHKVKISVDVFGLTTTAGNDMGIGQDLKVLARHADYVYPMMYPSHYYPGEYGLKDPNGQPYKVINRGLKDAFRRLGTDYAKLRPYLQDFSLGRRYGPHEVRAQLIAVKHNMLESWVLWNASNRYNWEALTPQAYRAFVCPDCEPVVPAGASPAAPK